jgi:O2-independent ubiquinone biosynthesis accessory factor UbiT
MSPVPTPAQPWRLPVPVSMLVSRLPQLPPSAALAAVLDLVVTPMLDRDVLATLEGKVVRIVVRDAGLTLSVRCRGLRFVPADASAAADTTIGACIHDFALLAARREDPDTLFFARRLTMEGDTEVGLIVKNLLDGVDLPMVATVLDRFIGHAERLRALFPFAAEPPARPKAR